MTARAALLSVGLLATPMAATATASLHSPGPPRLPTHIAGVALRPVSVHVNTPTSSFAVPLVTAVDAPALLEDGDAGSIVDGSDAYGAELWPSSLVAARTLLEVLGNTAAHKSVLELGCGVGLPTMAALMAGATRVTATDYSPFSLALVDASARCCFGEEEAEMRLRTALFDLCDPASDLTQLNWPVAAQMPSADPLTRVAHDIVVVSDMLYDVAMAQAIGRHVARAAAGGATVIIVDTDRLEGRGRSAFASGLLQVVACSDVRWSPASLKFTSVPLPAAELSVCASLRWSGDDTTSVGLLVLKPSLAAAETG